MRTNACIIIIIIIIIIISSKCRQLQRVKVPPESLTRVFAPGPNWASSQTILQVRSTTLAQILPSYIIPSRSLRSSSTTISAPMRKTSIGTSRSFSSTASDVWDKLPVHVSSASTLPVFRRQAPFYSFMPTLDSLHRPSKSEFITVSCRPPNAFQPSAYNKLILAFSLGSW